MKASWSGMISFGLVNIPVELFPATEDKDVSFRLLHGADDGVVKNQRVCTHCEQIVPFKDIVRGFEHAKGQFVILTDEDLKSAAPESSRNIDIEEFVDPSEIDPIYYDKPYYIGPGKNAKKAFGLLLKAMEASGKVGLAKVSLRTRERVAMVRVSGSRLMLQMLHYHDETRAGEEFNVDESAASERELKMAGMLIDSMAAKFEPEKYKDRYEENLHRVIDDKLAGKAPGVAEERREATNVIDLVAQLKASIERMEERDGRAAHMSTDEDVTRRAA
jgi:DNA end-binding protein Ku